MPPNFAIACIADVEALNFSPSSKTWFAALSNAILKAAIAPTVATSPIAIADIGLFNIGRIIDNPISGIISFCESSPTFPGTIDPTIAAPAATPTPPANPIFPVFPCAALSAASAFLFAE